jgi:small conductance mechanosensitive channel
MSRFEINDNFRTAIYVVIILLSGYILSRIVRVLINRFLKRSSETGTFDATSVGFLKNAIGFVIFIITIALVLKFIPGLNSLGTTLLASAGIMAAIIGFASQQAFSNIISGIFLVLFKPFRVGDFIKIDDIHFGTVEDVTLRHTVIRNPENRRVIIPNTIISNNTIINSNYLDPRVCSHIEIGISYSSNIDHAMKLIISEASSHRFYIDGRTEEQISEGYPLVIVRVISLGDFSVNLRAYVWARNNSEAFVMKCDLLKSIKERFDKEGIEIPFPYRTLIIRRDKEDGDEKYLVNS